MVETASVIEIYHCLIHFVEYNPMAFDDDCLQQLDDLDLAERYVKGSVWTLHCHFHRLNVVDYCHPKIKVVKI